MQGCGFRDRIQKLSDLGAVVLGISFDTVEENKHFAEKNNFPFKLLSDLDRSVGLAYGATEPGSTRGAKRIAYVIQAGKITHTYVVKDAAGHAEQVIDDLS